MDLANFSLYIGGMIRTFIRAIYNGINVTIAGTSLTLYDIIVAGIIISGISISIGILVNRS